MIDNGRIIPRYAGVQGANGMNYWRRFFTPGFAATMIFDSILT